MNNKSNNLQEQENYDITTTLPTAYIYQRVLKFEKKLNRRDRRKIERKNKLK